MQGLMWFTQFENTKPVALMIFFTVFCGILFYVFGSRARGARLESYKDIPLLDDSQDAKGN